jgi:hypothetical protein
LKIIGFIFQVYYFNFYHVETIFYYSCVF